MILVIGFDFSWWCTKKKDHFFFGFLGLKRKILFLPHLGFKRLRQMAFQPQLSSNSFTVWCPTSRYFAAGSKASSFWGGQVVKDGFFCETGHHGHIGGLEGISGHDFRHVFIANVLQRSFSMNQIANVQFILWADFLPISWALSDLNWYLAPEAPAMLYSGIEWKIHFRGKTVETLIFNIFRMSWLRDGYPTILKPAWSQGKSLRQVRFGQEMFAKLAPLQSKLDEQRPKHSAKRNTQSWKFKRLTVASEKNICYIHFVASLITTHPVISHTSSHSSGDFLTKAWSER